MKTKTVDKMVTPSSPRSISLMNPDASDRDINEVVEEAAARFDEFDNHLKLLIQDLKDHQASMMQLSESRLKTAKHLESFAANSPFSKVISPISLTKAVVGMEVIDYDAPTPDEDATHEDSKKVDPDKAKDVTKDVKKEEKKVELEATVAEIPAAANDNDVSFLAVHESVYNLSKKYHEQYNEYLIKYAEEWEHTVSSRVHGLLVHYRELHHTAEHYSIKVIGLIHKVDRTKNVREALAEKLDRNEIKEMGAFEARDTVGESLFLLIDEITERAWRDVFPLLLRTCRFEADFSAAQANLLSQLNTVAAALRNFGADNDCDMAGRLNVLMHKHTQEIYSVENPFVKLTPIENVKEQVLEETHKSEGDNVTDEVQDSNAEREAEPEEDVEL